MKFALVSYISQDIDGDIIQDLSEKISSFLNNKVYGKDVEKYYIGIMCVDQEYEQFFKIRKPKYTSEKKIYEKGGIKYEIEKTVEYDIKIDYETFKQLNKNKAQELLAEKILESISIISKIKKIKDFNIESFSFDLIKCFKELQLLPPASV